MSVAQVRGADDQVVARAARHPRGLAGRRVHIPAGGVLFLLRRVPGCRRCPAGRQKSRVPHGCVVQVRATEDVSLRPHCPLLRSLWLHLNKGDKMRQWEKTLPAPRREEETERDRVRDTVRDVILTELCRWSLRLACCRRSGLNK